MKNRKINFRTFFVLFLLLVLYLSVVGYLFYLQVIKGKYFSSLSNNNFFKTRYVYSQRGRILDRNKQVIVDNERKFRLILMIKEQQNIINILENIEEILDIDADNLKKKMKNNYFSVIKTFENTNDLNSWKFNNKVDQNVFLEEYWCRKNIYKSFNHITGYMQYAIFLEKPLKGLEKTYNKLLEGKIIEHRIFMDTRHNIINHVKIGEEESGQDLSTTLFIPGQLYAEKLFGNYKGGVIVMNHLGEIIVNFSSPMLKVYDNTPVSENYFLNKTMQEKYPPGSFFKIISALTLLKQNKKIDPVVCTGHIKIGNRNFYCWKRAGHGIIEDIAEAIQCSCNIFFYKNCLKLDDFAEDFFTYLQAVGFNNKTQNIISEEVASKISFPKSKMQMMMIAIGQGLASTTILQNCVAIASIMSGKKIVPTFVSNNQIFSKIPIEDDILKKIQNYIKSTFQGKGTCAGLAMANRDFFGKTGTAQIMSMKEGKSFLGYKREHSIFVGGEGKTNLYISILVENAGFGSKIAGTFATQLLDFIIKNWKK